jgi:hypothetical protein
MLVHPQVLVNGQWSMILGVNCIAYDQWANDHILILLAND